MAHAKVHRAILTALSQTQRPIFDVFIEECQKVLDTAAHNLQELHEKSTKTKGDLFEAFALLYFKKVKFWDNVWLLQQVPDDILNELNLGRRDMGIDLIGCHQGAYYAIQCKYKKANAYKKYTGVNWKELSTFQALCSRSGPWQQEIVITNCDYVKHQGKRMISDRTIAKKTLQNITRDQWLAMIGDHGYRLIKEPKKQVEGKRKIVIRKTQASVNSLQELREKRLAYFSN